MKRWLNRISNAFMQAASMRALREQRIAGNADLEIGINGGRTMDTFPYAFQYAISPLCEGCRG